MPFLALLGNPLVRYGLAAIAVLSLLGGLYGVGHHQGALSERHAWEGRVAEQKAQAADLLAKINKANADKAAADALFARTLDEAHANEERRIAESASAAERGFSERLRRIAGSRVSCPSTPGPSTSDTRQPADDPTGGRDRLSAEIGRDFAEVGKAAGILSTYVKECQAWVAKNGR